MMNKWFAGLMVCGLAMGMAACSDEDNKNCMAEDPALNTEADAFEKAVKEGGVTYKNVADPDNANEQIEVASDCEKFAENMNNYLTADDGANRTRLLEAIQSYPKFSGSFLGVLCGLKDTNKTISAAKKIVRINTAGNNCLRVETSDPNAQWRTDMNSGLNSLSTAEGWDNMLQAAASEASKDNSSN